MLTRMAQPARSIVFVSDFGLSNEWVGICHAVMNRISPASPIVDLSHLVPTLDVLSGALLIRDALPYIADDAVVLGVVDPNVGRDRDIAVEAEDGRVFVGPDNGLFAPAWKALGGVRRAVEITSDKVILHPVSPMFHARDVFAPAAVHISAGLAFDELGHEIEIGTLTDLQVPEPEVEPGKITCEVIDFNRFGNIQLNVRQAHLVEAGLDGTDDVAVEAIAGSARARRGQTYADFEAGEYGLLMDPRGWLMVVRGNPGSALEGLGVSTGDLVWLSSPDGEPAG
jgi:S-adenosyl-L-methionine hydrolase (adenosine-forming)